RTPGHSEPEPVRRLHVGALVDVYAKDQVVRGNGGGLDEAQEEPDQIGVAVHEDDSVGASIRLALRSFAPVGDGARDDDLAVGKRADLAGGGIALSNPPRIPDWLLG